MTLELDSKGPPSLILFLHSLGSLFCDGQLSLGMGDIGVPHKTEHFKISYSFYVY